MRRLVEGTAELIAAMTALDFSRRNELYEGLKKAAQPIVDSAQSKVNVRTGNLRASIGFIERRKKAYYKSVVLIGARSYGGWKGNHAHLVEFGTLPRQLKNIKMRGKNPDPEAGYRGFVAPGKFAFMEPAFKQNEPIVRANIDKLIKTMFKKELGKYTK